ncbi:MAG: 4Fe-4S dicluster domain-containing protein, partial [Proteobacteria bacterium]|nr:4Fe-4S dicluster domain-containing protein [Pseudomonadota bacterium]
KDNIVVADCICRKGNGLVDGNCGKPLEACFMFGSMAEYYIDHNLGRKIDVDEALKILKEAQDSGLVTQPASAVIPGGMCNCCGDCCGLLKAIAEQPKPAEAVFSNYYAQIDDDECSGCEECIDRCQMGAIKMNDDNQSEIDFDRCIGCGLCVTACPIELIRLKAKDEKDRRVPAINGEAMMTNMGRNRGT